MITICWPKLRRSEFNNIAFNLTIYCRYPEYQFISDNKISQLAAENTRYSFNSLFGVVFDIEMLSESDYIVCTFSSQVSLIVHPSLFNRISCRFADWRMN